MEDEPTRRRRFSAKSLEPEVYDKQVRIRQSSIKGKDKPDDITSIPQFYVCNKLNFHGTFYTYTCIIILI
jgi:hypothetical protein